MYVFRIDPGLTNLRLVIARFKLQNFIFNLLL